MNETHCSYGYYQDTSEYVKKMLPLMGQICHFWNICSLSDTLNLNPHE